MRNWLTQLCRTKSPHDLPSTLVGPRKASAAVPLQTRRPEIQGLMVLSPGLSLKAQEVGAFMSKGRKRWLSQLKQREQIRLSSAFLFYLGPQQIGWCLPTSSLLSLLIQMGELSQKYPEIMLYQLSGHTLAQSSWHMKLTIIRIK